MKVIGAGFGRMGTMSLKAALERIGYGPCLHMVDVIQNPDLLPPWKDAAEGNEVDWNAALDGWESTIDWPACSFWREHHETWPDLPVLLNTRDREAWYKSCLNSIHEAKEAALRGELKPSEEGDAVNPETVGMINKLIWQGTFEGHFMDKEFAFRKLDEHYDAVRAAVPSDQLLEYDCTKEGWGPLCEFLGVEAPDEPFPHLNDTKSFRAQFGLPALENA